MVCFHSIC
ncbi:hypothetical protein D018_3005A, partial [Vibrio parahaemolyticus VP2007-007]